MTKIISGIVALIVVVAGGWFAYQYMQTSGSEPAPSEVTPEEDEVVAEEEMQITGEPVSAYTVRYGASGFSPATLEVPLGTTVTFINQGGPDMWVGSDDHPTHTHYDGTSVRDHCEGSTPSTTAFDQCSVGSTYSFTFTKAGEWGYHNHRQASHTGTIVVQ